MLKDDYFALLERLFTCALVLLVIALFGDSLAGYWWLVFAGLVGALAFSWAHRSLSSSQRGSILAVSSGAAILVCIWVVATLLRPLFGYQEVVMVFLKGALLLIVILGVNTSTPVFLSHIQFLTIPLFMGSMVFMKGAGVPAAILIAAYCLAWGGVLKCKLYAVSEPMPDTGRSWWQYFMLPSALLAATLVVSWALFYFISVSRLAHSGILPVEENEKVRPPEARDKEYYRLQDTLQGQMTKIILRFRTTGEQHEGLAQIGSLIQETVDDVMEIEEAAEGLVSFLKTPGAGIEAGERQQTSYLMQEYLEKKAGVNMTRLNEKIMEKLSKEGMHVMQVLAAAYPLNGMNSARSYKQLVAEERKLLRQIDSSVTNKSAKSDMGALVQQLKEWKVLSLFRQKLRTLAQKAETQDSALLKNRLKELVSELQAAANPADLKEMQSDGERFSSDFSYAADISKEVAEAIDLKIGTGSMQQRWLLKKTLSEAGVPASEVRTIEQDVRAIQQEPSRQEPGAASSGERLQFKIDQLQDKLEQEADAAFLRQETKEELVRLAEQLRQTAELQVQTSEKESQVAKQESIAKTEAAFLQTRRTIDILLWILLIGMFVLAAGLPMVFFVLYLITSRNKQAILAQYQDPRRFIIALYENLKKALSIYGVSQAG